MLQTILINMIGNAVFKKLKDKIVEKAKGKVTYTSVALLVVGLVSSQLGIDIAPAEVDAVVTAVATIGAVWGRYRATKD